MLGNILGDFFSNSSGHPADDQSARFKICIILAHESLDNILPRKRIITFPFADFFRLFHCLIKKENGILEVIFLKVAPG
jgi:hypothetical protein